MDKIKSNYIREQLDEVDLWMQLAEELDEMGKAACKMARIKKGSNPTPILEEDAMDNVLEEFADVLLCCQILRLRIKTAMLEGKLTRWCKRIKEARDGRNQLGKD